MSVYVCQKRMMTFIVKGEATKKSCIFIEFMHVPSKITGIWTGGLVLTDWPVVLWRLLWD